MNYSEEEKKQIIDLLESNDIPANLFIEEFTRYNEDIDEYNIDILKNTSNNDNLYKEDYANDDDDDYYDDDEYYKMLNNDDDGIKKQNRFAFLINKIN